MKFAAVFAFALFAFVAQAHAGGLEGPIEIGVLDIVKKEVAIKRDQLQGLVSKETAVTLNQISNSVNKVRNQATGATQMVGDNIGQIAAKVDALKREAIETNNILQDLITIEHELVNTLIKKISANVNGQIKVAAEIVLDKVCKVEDRLALLFKKEPLEKKMSEKEW